VRDRLRSIVTLGSCILVGASLASGEDVAGPPAPKAAAESAHGDSGDDGWPDMSRFLDKAAGFVPIVHPITEPAVGYGAAVGLLFVDRPKGEGAAGFARPNLTALGGALTENGTWGGMVGDIRHWRHDRLKTTVALFDGGLNLDHYGIGNSPALQDVPLAYEWAPLGGRIGADLRIRPKGNLWVGLSYTAARNEITFKGPSDTDVGILETDRSLVNANLTPSVMYDSRDTIFTPSRGVYASVSGSFYETFLGSDRDFQEGDATAIGYVPLGSRLTFGLRGDGKASFGSVPFYLRPAVSLRGVTAMRYQGHYVAQAEGELRYQFWKRFSLVGFGGAGTTWGGSERLDPQQTVGEGGGGLRYELARRYKLHGGFDVAFGPDGLIWYVVMGSAWARP
jgi:hypothetical protein